MITTTCGWPSCLQVVLGDGTIRSTFAATTNKSVVEALPAAVVRSCPVYAAAAKGLRQSVDRTGLAWARMLDRYYAILKGACGLQPLLAVNSLTFSFSSSFFSAD